MKKKNELFIDGPIAPEVIAESIAKHASKRDIGAHSIFLGQVRADEIDGKTVQAIEYTAYRTMAEIKIAEIRETVFAAYPLTCMHIYHSLGSVPTGAICLFVFTSSKHRKAAIAACDEVVERIKNELPIWGREIFDDESHHWKVNR